MTTDEKLAAILAAVQIDPGNRGLAKLFPVCAADFAAACRSIADHPNPELALVTGFFIPTAIPPSFETDGPLGVMFFYRALTALGIFTSFHCEKGCYPAFDAALETFSDRQERYGGVLGPIRRGRLAPKYNDVPRHFSHIIAIERAGPGLDNCTRTMRGIDVTKFMEPAHELFQMDFEPSRPRTTIGIGDGGNEIGMGKLPHELVAANVPNGDLIHCRVATDFLIVAGVSNWGAYALAAGVYVLRGKTPPPDLFDPDREREILEVMVREGPLVDGVTGKQTATVDGLSWEDYAKPLVRIGKILKR